MSAVYSDESPANKRWLNIPSGKPVISSTVPDVNVCISVVGFENVTVPPSPTVATSGMKHPSAVVSHPGILELCTTSIVTSDWPITTVIVTELEALDVPVLFVAVAVKVWAPSDSVGVVNVQSPLVFAVTVPKDVVPSKISIVVTPSKISISASVFDVPVSVTVLVVIVAPSVGLVITGEDRTVSTVIVTGVDGIDDTELIVAIAVNVWSPSVSVSVENVQSPLASAVAVPKDVAPSKTWMVLLASAAPVSVTVSTLIVAPFSGSIITGGDGKSRVSGMESLIVFSDENNPNALTSAFAATENPLADLVKRLRETIGGVWNTPQLINMLEDIFKEDSKTSWV